MCKWFVGKAPRPSFDHWNYQQKVDYWAPFWGITMLVATGAMLWFKTLTAAYLPGWVFNVATVAHGDEAVLAAAYLFTRALFRQSLAAGQIPARRRHVHRLDAAGRVQARIRRRIRSPGGEPANCSGIWWMRRRGR